MAYRSLINTLAGIEGGIRYLSSFERPLSIFIPNTPDQFYTTVYVSPKCRIHLSGI